MKKGINKGKHFNEKSRTKSKCNKLRPSILLIICVLIVLIVNINNIVAFLIDFQTLTNRFRVENAYIIIFDANGGTGEMANQTIFYNTTTNLTENTFTKIGCTFDGWNTNADGTGTAYDNGQEVTNLTQINNEEIVLYAQWLEEDGIAKIGDYVYQTLQDAVNAVPTDNTETEIKLLKSTSECITVAKNKNIIFNFQNYTLSNGGTKAVIENNGTIKIYNGNLTSSSTSDALINNNSTGKIVISGGRLTDTGPKQVLYNNGGVVEITGSAYLSANAENRATVHNQERGTLTISGGTIVSTSPASSTDKRGAVQNMKNGILNITGGSIISQEQFAVNNSAVMTIGTKDGNVDTTSPVIQGATYGVSSSTNFKFYDGIIKGKTNDFNNEAKIEEKEEGYNVVHHTELIDEETYQTAYLAITNLVTFNAVGGTISESTRGVEYGDMVGSLPTTVKPGCRFDGWFTEEDGGTEVTAETIVTEDVTFYAHWTDIYVAEINGTKYRTLQNAINAVPTDNTETEIKVLYDTSEALNVAANKNIVFDLQNYTIRNNGNARVIINKGTIKISNGTITSSAEYAAIDNEIGGVLKISGGKIIATGARQAVYNNGGTLEISGNAYLISSAPERGTVQNLESGTLSITGGTIISKTQQAVVNAANLTVGVKDGSINENSPVLQGATYGVDNSGVFNFYDGVAKGITDSINGSITEMEDNSNRIDGTEQIDGEIYQTTYLGF